MDLNKLLARVKAILLTPKTEWPIIAGEPASIGGLYRNYILILAAIPAVFAFLKLSVIGISMPFGGTARIGIGAGLSQLVLGYVLTLVMIYVIALIIDALAPTFGGQKDQLQAFKAATYAYTASWIAGIAHILPGVGALIVILGGLYGIYLLYLGLPHTMKCPEGKAAGYTAVTVIVAIVLGVVVGMLTSALGGAGMGMGSFTSSSNNEVVFDKDSPLGKLEQYGKQMEQAGKKLEAAQKSGDQDAHAAALKQAMGAAFGGGAAVEALAPDRLKPFVPDTLAGLPRTDISVERNQAMGMQIAEAKATYSDDSGRSVRLEITDTGSAKGLLGLAGWAGVESEKQTANGYEKTYRDAGRLIHEKWQGTQGQYTLVLGDRFTVEVNGTAGSLNELKAAAAALDLKGLEALKNEGVKSE